MPATEQTWRDSKKLHGVFMASSLALLVATMWMFYADHSREWKKFNDTARDLDLVTIDWAKIQYESDQKHHEREHYKMAFDKARVAPLNEGLLEKFTTELNDADATTRLLGRNEELKKLVSETLKAPAKTTAPTPTETKPEDTKAEVPKKDESPEAEVVTPIEQRVISKRESLLDELRKIVAHAKFVETTILDNRKNTSALLDAAKAKFDIGVRDSVDAEGMKLLEEDVLRIKAKLDQLTLDYQAKADHRKLLDRLVKAMTQDEDEAKKAFDNSSLELNNLRTAYRDREMTYFMSSFPYLGKKWLTWPILDAFNSPRKIENLWVDGLTIDYNFSKVRRYDRCTTCHQSMEKSLPGQPEKPLYVKEEILNFTLATPSAKPAEISLDEEKSNAQLEELYGIRLASAGALDRDAVTLSYVVPRSSAAKAELLPTIDATTPLSGDELREKAMQTNFKTEGKAEEYPVRRGLMFGDVITQIGDDVVRNAAEAKRFLLKTAQFGKPLTVTVRRGLDSPYLSHPRLDLFVGSTSPHKLANFACSSCHEGQGSATQFKWASHMPNDPEQRKEWARKYGWFDNAHWIFPMYPKRFAESACLKCHHNVVELEPSEKFPEPPAPKVTHGYHLIRKYGCYGCHEISGFDGPNRRVGPDMRLEPNFFAGAHEVRAILKQSKVGEKSAYDALSDSEKGWIETLIDHPDRDDVRHRLYEIFSSDEKVEKSKQRFTAEVRKVASVLKDIDTPGDLRKPGPSLRHVASKLDDQFLYDWIREPKHFRPDTRMPQFFGLHKHLEAEPESKKMAEEFEPIEILAMANYLKNRSQGFDFLKAEKGITAGSGEEQVARGKVAFEERGCLACHNHKDFTGTKNFRQPNEIVQGPDLSGIGSKFDLKRNPKGKEWLYSWIKQPTKYHSRTVMPDLFLDPIAKKDENGKVTSVTDPAADIVEYLLSSTNDWQPAKQTLTKLDSNTRTTLDKLIFDNLKESFYETSAEKYAKFGIPAAMEKELKGAEKELITSANSSLSDEQKLQYIGRKSIAKYGCYGCHDIPGFEDAKPIGTALADWGKKDPAKLAFEHIAHYLHGHGGDGHGAEHGHESEAMPEFYKEQLDAANRTGFLYQKLAEPRSYDYMKTENKKYNERLRMPQFPFSVEEREDIITFVLGLIADPPAAKFVYKPDAHAEAMIAGRQAIDKFNCAGCHMLSPEKWKVSFAPGGFGEQPEVKTYPFLAAHYSPEQLDASKKVDYRGLLNSTLSGMPSINDADGKANVTDSEGDLVDPDNKYAPNTLTYPFELWSQIPLEGKPFNVGVVPLNIAANRLEERQSSRGGVLAKYLLPRVLQREKQVNPAAKGGEAWAWLPPPLMGEGTKVQSNWLHDFLLNPYPIRPAVVLRMPRFNMSPAEATNLAKYFAAVDGAEYPYQFSERRQSTHTKSADAAYEKVTEGKSRRMDDAMKIVTNGNYCVKCHIVSDFEPKGAERAKAPNLARVYERLRPGYLRDWIANPKQILPYTSMPVNIPYNPEDTKNLGGVSQELYHGTSIEQLDGLVDLLMNYDNYAKQRNLIAPLVQQAPSPNSDGAEKEKKDAASGGGQ